MNTTPVIKIKRFQETSLYSSVKVQVEGMLPERGEAFGDILTLKEKGRTGAFHFEWFDLEAYSAARSYTVTVDNQEFTIKTSTLAWILWCDCINSVEHMKSKTLMFEILLSLFAYLTAEKKDCVTVQSISDFLEVLITHSTNISGLSKRLGLRGPMALFTFKPKVIHASCKRLGLNPMIQAVTSKKLKSIFNEVTMLVADMSYADYQEGGSFNFLTLDIGKHYVNHLDTLFSKYYYAAYAVADVKKQKLQMLGGRPDSGVYQNFMHHALAGKSSLPESMSANKKAYDEIKLRVDSAYSSSYKKAVRMFAIFSDYGVDTLLERLGLVHSDDNKLFVKSLMAIELSKSDVSQNEIIRDYSNSLQYVKLNSRLTIDKYRIEKEQLVEQLLEKEVVITPNESLSQISTFDSVVGRYGFTQVMALLGWRESEYTFPESAIELFRNNDVVDQVRYPVRFNVKWVVPKTAGKTKVNREITLTSYVLMKKLQELHCATEEEPMLYNFESNKFVIGQRANKACVSGWQHFVENYSVFIDLDRFEKLKSKSAKLTLDLNEKEMLSELASRYQHSDKTQQLLSIRDKVRSDLPNLIAAGMLTTHKKGRVLIDAYSHRTMEWDKLKVWDKSLSLEQKEYIVSLSESEKIPRGSVNDIINTIKVDCAYPTPHAFRHMWAECVYRRYSGDVGWLIRTNFKHFGEQFYRRYLREKHMQVSENIAKRRVVSSILNAHLNSMKHEEKREFGGKMDVFLRRVLKQTKAISPDEIGGALKEFASLEIADIKANPWGYCMLKNRNKHKANCALEGIPKRENAGIEFCIGCTNHLVEQEHVAFIILNVANHVRTLKQPLPAVFKVESQRIVKETIKTLKQLDKNSNTSRNEKYIKEMQSAIDMSGKIEVEAV